MSLGTLSRKERDQQLRREDILNAAEHLFAQKGFHHTTMEDIAHAAEYGTGTIYLYFKTKDDLYEALLERKIGEYVAFVQERVNQAPDPLGKIRALVYAKLEYFDRHKEFFRIYLMERSTVDSTLRRCVTKRREKMYYEHQAFVSDMLAKAMKVGAIRKTDPAKLATVLTGAINPLLSEWIKNRSKDPVEDIGDFVMDVLMEGLHV